MSTEEQVQVQAPPPEEDLKAVQSQDAQMQDAAPAPPTGPSAMATGNRKRPRLDLAVDARERKRGKTVFGLVLGTLNKAKNEDKERNASDAAKKRQLIEQRLQDKLRKETDTVRRAEEAKKDKTSANRKEEDLQLKDSIYKLRRTRLPHLANFLCTSDQIPSDDSDSPPPSNNPLATAPRSHPPPLYYLPAILLPSQEIFLKRRKIEVKEAVEKEWATFRVERSAGIEEISLLRKRVAEEEARKKSEQQEEAATDAGPGEPEQDVKMVEEDTKESAVPPPPAPIPAANGTTDAGKAEEHPQEPAAEMEVDEEGAAPEPARTAAKEDSAKEATTEAAPARKVEPSALMQADEDDAVEY